MPEAGHRKEQNLFFFRCDPGLGPYQISATDHKTLKISEKSEKSEMENKLSFYNCLSLFSFYCNALNILLCNYNRMCFTGQGFPRAEHWKAQNLSFFQYDPRDGPYQTFFTDQKTLKMSEKVRNGKQVIFLQLFEPVLLLLQCSQHSAL